MMNFVPAMWAVWAFLVLAAVILKLYISRLGRDEDDELILQESSEHLRTEQAAILSRLHRVEPVQRAFLWVLGAASLFVAIYYIHDMVSQFR
jgi:hypothetical protein